METVIRALESEVSGKQKELDKLRGILDQLRSYNDPTAPTTITSIMAQGQFEGLKPFQAIRDYLKSRGNPGVTQDEIVNALLKEGSVLSGKKYPKRSVALAIVNSPEIFVEKSGLVYLK